MRLQHLVLGIAAAGLVGASALAHGVVQIVAAFAP